MKSISAIHPAITENMLVKHASQTSMHESHIVSISTMPNSFHSMRSASVIFMSRTEAIMCLPQIVTLHSCEERMGDQKGTKVAP